MNEQVMHPYFGQTVYFGTKHEKDAVISPILDRIGIRCRSVSIDTDQLGTFSGESKRVGSIRETLRKKIEMTFEAVPSARLALASEGSFGPHPLMPLVPSDHEALLFVDKVQKIEIYVDEISMGTNFTEVEFRPRDDLDTFLKKVKFPTHAVVVNTKHEKPLVFKGLNTFHAVGQAIIDAFMSSAEPVLILSTDMRACFNPTRMDAIKNVGEKLLKHITSFCSRCSSIGFGPTKNIEGLPCEQCGLETNRIRAIQYTCLKCNYIELKPREDGLLVASAGNCDFCNP